MKSFGKVRISLLVAAIFIIACFALRRPLLRATMPNIEDVSLTEFVLHNDSAFVKLSLNVRNRGFWTIDLTHVRIGIYDDSLEIMTYESDTVITFTRNEVRTEILYCKIPFTEVIERIRARQGEDSVALQMKGEFVYTTIFGESSSVVEREIPVSVPIPPRMFIRGVSYLNKNDGVYNLVFDVTLQNDNPRTINLQDVKYELLAGQSVELRGHLENITIAALDSTQLQVPAAMTLGSHFGIITRIILDSDQMPYSFVLKGTIVSLTGIVSEDVPITVTTTGHMELFNENNRDRPRINFRKKQR